MWIFGLSCAVLFFYLGTLFGGGLRTPRAIVCETAAVQPPRPTLLQATGACPIDAEGLAALEWELERVKARSVEIFGPMKWECMPKSLQDRYMTDVENFKFFLAPNDPQTFTWSQQLMKEWTQRALSGENIAPGYGNASPDVLFAVRWLAGNRSVALDASNGLVVGSLSPWVEAVLIGVGVQKVVTVDFNVPRGCETLAPRQQCLHVNTFRTLPRNQAQFDIVVSYSSLEHDGLGRYGDPLNPDGDLAAVHEIYSMAKPGAYVLIAVPFGHDELHFWAHRVYGPKRIKKLFAGFEILGMVWAGKFTSALDLSWGGPAGEAGTQPVFILRRPDNGKPYWTSK